MGRKNHSAEVVPVCLLELVCVKCGRLFDGIGPARDLESHLHHFHGLSVGEAFQAVGREINRAQAERREARAKAA